MRLSTIQTGLVAYQVSRAMELAARTIATAEAMSAAGDILEDMTYPQNSQERLSLSEIGLMITYIGQRALDIALASIPTEARQEGKEPNEKAIRRYYPDASER